LEHYIRKMRSELPNLDYFSWRSKVFISPWEVSILNAPTIPMSLWLDIRGFAPLCGYLVDEACKCIVNQWF
jgi:hypothetical protein